MPTWVIGPELEKSEPIALIASPDARPYVRMIMERLFPTLPVLSHMEIVRAPKIQPVASLS